MKVKLFTPSFTIKIANKHKNKLKTDTNKISRKCLAIVVKIDNEFKAIINYEKNHICIKEGDTLSNEQIILPFTEQSFNLKNKIHVWLKEKDKYGYKVRVTRTEHIARLSPGTSTQYDVFKENMLILGYIIRKDGKMYFEYKELVSNNYLSNYIHDIKIDNSKPLFNK